MFIPFFLRCFITYPLSISSISTMPLTTSTCHVFTPPSGILYVHEVLSNFIVYSIYKNGLKLLGRILTRPDVCNLHLHALIAFFFCIFCPLALLFLLFLQRCQFYFIPTPIPLDEPHILVVWFWHHSFLLRWLYETRIGRNQK